MTREQLESLRPGPFRRTHTQMRSCYSSYRNYSYNHYQTPKQHIPRTFSNLSLEELNELNNKDYYEFKFNCGIYNQTKIYVGSKSGRIIKISIEVGDFRSGYADSYDVYTNETKMWELLEKYSEDTYEYITKESYDKLVEQYKEIILKVCN